MDSESPYPWKVRWSFIVKSYFSDLLNKGPLVDKTTQKVHLWISEHFSICHSGILAPYKSFQNPRWWIVTWHANSSEASWRCPEGRDKQGCLPAEEREGIKPFSAIFYLHPLIPEVNLITPGFCYSWADWNMFVIQGEWAFLELTCMLQLLQPLLRLSPATLKPTSSFSLLSCGPPECFEGDGSWKLEEPILDEGKRKLYGGGGLEGQPLSVIPVPIFIITK